MAGPPGTVRCGFESRSPKPTPISAVPTTYGSPVRWPRLLQPGVAGSNPVAAPKGRCGAAWERIGPHGPEPLLISGTSRRKTPASFQVRRRRLLHLGVPVRIWAALRGAQASWRDAHDRRHETSGSTQLNSTSPVRSPRLLHPPFQQTRNNRRRLDLGESQLQMVPGAQATLTSTDNREVAGSSPVVAARPCSSGG